GRVWTNAVHRGERFALPSRLAAREQPLDAELAEFLGWLVSKGAERTADASAPALHFVLQERQCQQRLYKLACSLAVRYRLGTGALGIQASSSRSTFTLTLGSNAFQRFLTQLGHELGQPAAHRRTPDCVMRANDEGVAQFLRALFDAAGWVAP